MRDDLTDEDVRRLEHLRKGMWKAGFAGFGLGGAWGLGNCLLLRTIRAKGLESYPDHQAFKAMPRLQSKHLTFVTLTAAATGMFIGSLTEGARAKEQLRDIIDRKMDEDAIERQQQTFPLANLSRDSPEYRAAQESAGSYERRMEAIKAAKNQDDAERNGTSKSGRFKAW